jgi:hypothetical protein
MIWVGICVSLVVGGSVGWWIGWGQGFDSGSEYRETANHVLHTWAECRRIAGAKAADVEHDA